MKAADDKTSAPNIQKSVKAQVTAFSTLPFAGTRKPSGFFLKPGLREQVLVRGVGVKAAFNAAETPMCVSIMLLACASSRRLGAVGRELAHDRAVRDRRPTQQNLVAADPRTRANGRRRQLHVIDVVGK
jgi:hypothetical protein